MLKYLNYVTAELSKLPQKDISDALISEVNLYKEYWKKYSTDNSRNPLYQSAPSMYNRHTINLHTNEAVSISWDVRQLYGIAQHMPIKQASLRDFETLLHHDLVASANEISRISHKINSIHTHQYNPILVMNFKPIKNSLLIDGRHRYVEYKKFNSSQLLPYYVIDDELCFSSILFKKELLSYIILHNIEIIDSFIIGQGTLERLLNLKKCMGS